LLCRILHCIYAPGDSVHVVVVNRFCFSHYTESSYYRWPQSEPNTSASKTKFNRLKLKELRFRGDGSKGFYLTLKPCSFCQSGPNLRSQ
jgi:hypothetical protein